MIWGVKKSQRRPGKSGKMLIMSVWLNCDWTLQEREKRTVSKLIVTHIFFMCLFLYLVSFLINSLLAFLLDNLSSPLLSAPLFPLPNFNEEGLRLVIALMVGGMQGASWSIQLTSGFVSPALPCFDLRIRSCLLLVLVMVVWGGLPSYLFPFQPTGT